MKFDQQPFRWRNPQFRFTLRSLLLWSIGGTVLLGLLRWAGFPASVIVPTFLYLIYIFVLRVLTGLETMPGDKRPEDE
jgi:hypothetical protein